MTINYEETQEYFEGPKTKTVSEGPTKLTGRDVVSFILFAAAGLLLFFGWKLFGFIINLLVMIGCVVVGATVDPNTRKEITIEPKMTDAEFDALQSDIDAQVAIRMAMDKFGLDEDEFKEIDPIVLSGPYFNSISSDYKTIKGKDGRVRSSNTEVVLFLFSAQQVFQFSSCFSLINPDENRYSTNEYFYRDIVTVSTESDVLEYEEKGNGSAAPTKAKYSYEKFVMRTTGGNSVSCAVRTTGESVQRSIQAMRQLLREKKNA